MSDIGRILQRALNKRAIMAAGVTVTLDEIDAGELLALMIIEEEQRIFDDEQEAKNGK